MFLTPKNMLDYRVLLAYIKPYYSLVGQATVETFPTVRAALGPQHNKTNKAVSTFYNLPSSDPIYPNPAYPNTY